MEKWEYKITTQDTEGFMTKRAADERMNDVLTELGEEGWELVSTTPVIGGAMMTKSITMFLKRKVTGQRG